MPKQTVWFSKKSITIYHLYEDCYTLDSADNEDIVCQSVDLKSDRTTDEETMRLCRVCKGKWEETKKLDIDPDILDKYFT